MSLSKLEGLKTLNTRTHTDADTDRHRQTDVERQRQKDRQTEGDRQTEPKRAHPTDKEMNMNTYSLYSILYSNGTKV